MDDGLGIHLWKDISLGHVPLMTLFPRIFAPAMDRNLTVGMYAIEKVSKDGVGI